MTSIKNNNIEQIITISSDIDEINIFDKMLEYYQNESHNYIDTYYANEKLTNNNYNQITNIIGIIDELKKKDSNNKEYSFFFNTIFGLIYKLKKNIVELEDEVDNNKSKLVKMTELEHDKTNTIKQIKESNSKTLFESIKKNNKLENTIKRLEEEHKKISIENNKNSNKLAELEILQAEYEEQVKLSSEKSNKKRIVNKYDKKSNEIIVLRKRVNDNIEHNQILEKENRGYQEVNTNLTNKLASISNEYDNLKVLFGHLRIDNNNLNEEYSKLTEEYSKLIGEYSKLTSELKKINKLQIQTESKIQTIINNCDIQEKKVSFLLADIINLNFENKKLLEENSKITELENNILNLNFENKKLLEENNKLNQNNVIITKNISKLSVVVEEEKEKSTINDNNLNNQVNEKKYNKNKRNFRKNNHNNWQEQFINNDYWNQDIISYNVPGLIEPNLSYEYFPQYYPEYCIYPNVQPMVMQYY